MCRKQTFEISSNSYGADNPRQKDEQIGSRGIKAQFAARTT